MQKPQATRVLAGTRWWLYSTRGNIMAEDTMWCFLSEGSRELEVNKHVHQQWFNNVHQAWCIVSIRLEDVFKSGRCLQSWTLPCEQLLFSTLATSIGIASGSKIYLLQDLWAVCFHYDWKTYSWMWRILAQFEVPVNGNATLWGSLDVGQVRCFLSTRRQSLDILWINPVEARVGQTNQALVIKDYRLQM